MGIAKGSVKLSILFDNGGLIWNRGVAAVGL
jgi:hypothetical protein